MPVCVAGLRNKGRAIPPKVPAEGGGTGHVQAERAKLVGVQPRTRPASLSMSPRLWVGARCCWSRDNPNNSIRVGNPPRCLTDHAYHPTGSLLPPVKVRRSAQVLGNALGAEQSGAGPGKSFGSSGTQYYTHIRESEGGLAITSELSLQVCRFCSCSSESL